MQLLDGLLAVQVLAILSTFLAEAVAGDPLVTVVVGTFAVAVIATFGKMTASLLSGLVGATIPDTTAERHR